MGWYLKIHPSSIAVQVFRRTWGARWQLFSARAIYQADVLTQPRHNKSSHVIPATSNNLAAFYFRDLTFANLKLYQLINRCIKSAFFRRWRSYLFFRRILRGKGQKIWVILLSWMYPTGGLHCLGHLSTSEHQISFSRKPLSPPVVVVPSSTIRAVF